MRWFRSNIRLGSRLALFALAVQILLSFGHVHARLISGKSNPSAEALAGLVVSDAPTPLGKSGGSGDFDCPICALIQLSAAAAPSVAPTLPLPANLGSVGFQAAADLPSAASPQLSFQARAPPSV